ncbi:hypothetical protein JTE90_027209 [Oedothorax gibbosus]|uniref:Uncharacterized protein n=1 Tax=Oedothorax gibbosus TaxID=931172 RepID=A0AAV6U5A9_9ARAC|nr:hypothetical protein JTE90_027209 [Oedothorax gibbosus]
MEIGYDVSEEQSRYSDDAQSQEVNNEAHTNYHPTVPPVHFYRRGEIVPGSRNRPYEKRRSSLFSVDMVIGYDVCEEKFRYTDVAQSQEINYEAHSYILPNCTTRPLRQAW